MHATLYLCLCNFILLAHCMNKWKIFYLLVSTQTHKHTHQHRHTHTHTHTQQGLCVLTMKTLLPITETLVTLPWQQSTAFCTHTMILHFQQTVSSKQFEIEVEDFWDVMLTFASVRSQHCFNFKQNNGLQKQALAWYDPRFNFPEKRKYHNALKCKFQRLNSIQAWIQYTS